MRLLLALICLAFSSCASIINGPDQEITIHSKPSGAEIAINGEEAGTTPVTVRLMRARDHVVTLFIPGYHVQTTQLTRELSGVSALYLLPGGLISMAIDSTKGAAYCFPDKVDVELLPLFDSATVIASHLNLLKSVGTNL